MIPPPLTPPSAPPPHLVSLWGTAVAISSFTPPSTSLFESRSPHCASILSILGSQHVKRLGGQALCVKVQIEIKKCKTLSRRSRQIYTFFLRAKKKNCRSKTLQPKRKHIYILEKKFSTCESWGNVPNARRDREGPLCNSISHLRVRVFVCFEFSLISEDSRQGHKDTKTRQRGNLLTCKFTTAFV